MVGEDSLNPTAVYLLRVGGTRFAAFNGTSAGEFLRYYFFDTNFASVTAFAM
jgi:hypothetical protein